FFFFFFSSRRRHTRSKRDWSSDVCSSDLPVRDVLEALALERAEERDRHLRAGGRFALGQERLEPLALGRLQEPRVVVHAAGRSGRQDEGNGKGNREEQARTSLWGRCLRRPPLRRTPWAGSPRSRPRASRETAAAG